jgi:hypothetical protein
LSVGDAGKPVRARLALSREPGRRLCQDIALLTQTMVLRKRASSSRSALVGPSARVPIGLLYPSRNRLCGRLELTRQIFRRAPGPDQFDHLSPELRRIGGSITLHGTPQIMTSKVSTKPGQLQSFVSVTQSFNTTTSVGRLTLNVLLSFAQFEREVSGERITRQDRTVEEEGHLDRPGGAARLSRPQRRPRSQNLTHHPA